MNPLTLVAAFLPAAPARRDRKQLSFMHRLQVDSTPMRTATQRETTMGGNHGNLQHHACLNRKASSGAAGLPNVTTGGVPACEARALPSWTQVCTAGDGTAACEGCGRTTAHRDARMSGTAAVQ